MATGAGKLVPVESRPRLADEIANSLRQAILSGSYEAGAKLGLEELAADLGVSIMPVREALITLSNEGLAIAEPRRGFRASPLGQQDLDDLFEIQAHLAGILAARAAESATSEDIAHLKDLHAQFEDASKAPSSHESADTLMRLNAEFHRAINRIPAGDRVRWFLRLTNRFVRNDLFESVPGMVQSALLDHPKLIGAIETHDAQEARRLMESHFLQGAAMVGGTLAADH